jgi:hypothetical protein
MTKFRRRRQQYLFASLLGVIAVVNVLFFLILYGPVRREYFRLQSSIQRAREDVKLRRAKIDRLEKLSAQLETSDQDRSELLTTYFIPKNSGWSEILPQLDAMVRKSGVKNVKKEYGLSEASQYGLYSVQINLPVGGPYSNVVNLIKEIENSKTFFIINSIDVRGNTETPSGVSMSLNLETFFYQ